MKKLILSFLSVILIQKGISQTIDYFGQTPPGDSAVMFAPGIISLTNRMEAGITFSPDGNECFFEIYEPNTPYLHKIYFTRRVNNIWDVQIEAPFSANNSNNFTNPIFSVNGKKLFFTKLNTDYTNGDIYMIERTTNGWSNPKPLSASINSDSQELGYTETADGVGYFNSVRPGGFDTAYGDIWCKYPSSDQAENLGAKVNTNTVDSEPCIAPDGSFLILGRTTLTSIGNLYICFNKGNNQWTQAINMNNSGAKINNNSVHHMNPSLSPDGKFLFFARHNGPILDIYWVSTHVLVGLKKSAFDLKLSKQIPNMNIKTDSAVHYIIPANTFTCKEGTGALKYSATLSNGLPLPSWLTFNADTRTLWGTPKQTETDSIKITATYTDDISASCIFKITVSARTEIIRSEGQNIKIFPNPTKGMLRISLSAPLKLANAEIYNNEGKLLIKKTFRSTPDATINLTGYPKGIYIIKVITDGIDYKEKIVID